MNALLKDVEKAILKHGLFRPGQRILVAVSGGVDSMVLLRVLGELAPRHRWQLSVAHLNHQLRGRASDADERLVRREAARLGLKVFIERAVVRDAARAGKVSIEMAARKIRHDFLARAARQSGARTVALAHHADDQVELFFLRLLRGSGGEGLSGMDWKNPSPRDSRIMLARPLLEISKETLRDFARTNRVSFREDASNESLDMQRNRIRNELLPLLKKKYQPALDRVIPRVAEILRCESEYVRKSAKQWLIHGKTARVAASSRSPKPSFDELDAAVQRRCLHLQLNELGVVGSFELIEELRLSPEHRVAVPASANLPAIANSQSPIAKQFERKRARRRGRGRSGGLGEDDLLAPLYAVRDGRGLVRLERIEEPRQSTAAVRVDLDGRTGTVELDDVKIRWRMIASKGGELPERRPNFELFDADRVGSSIVLRHWLPGDVFQPIGMKSAVKLQDIFTNLRISKATRHGLIMAVAASGEIFWVEGLRISERFKLTGRTMQRLEWRWERRFAGLKRANPR